jgi:hypothetical protein
VAEVQLTLLELQPDEVHAVYEALVDDLSRQCKIVRERAREQLGGRTVVLPDARNALARVAGVGGVLAKLDPARPTKTRTGRDRSRRRDRLLYETPDVPGGEAVERIFR